jgi:hypothetical protein
MQNHLNAGLVAADDFAYLAAISSCSMFVTTLSEDVAKLSAEVSTPSSFPPPLRFWMHSAGN